MTPMYTARATAVGGREGRVTSDDGFIDQQLQLPTGLGGKGGATNPEQLFAAGYAACFEGALRLVARTRGIAISSAKIEAEVDIGKDETSFGLAVRLHAHVGGVDAATAQALADGAHEVCPYSKATRGNIPVTVRGSAA
ncbi:MAG: organic hydroperoxide resistance protein [Xanthomonadales bacterium]|jgi:Ohr subfamily peroxiredoxin|nr:organic hydroperoxide resistance protein [Xanthomonadales bacterium]